MSKGLEKPKALRRENMQPVSFMTVVLLAPGGQTFAFSAAIEIADPASQDSVQGSAFPFRTRDEVRSVRVNHDKLRTFATHIVTEMQSAANLVPTMEVAVAVEKDVVLPLADGFTQVDPPQWGVHLEDGPGPSGVRTRMADYPRILSGIVTITVQHHGTLPSSSLLRHVHVDALGPDCRANDHAIGVYCVPAGITSSTAQTIASSYSNHYLNVTPTSPLQCRPVRQPFPATV
jgi:hypothetical protein